MKPTHRLPKSEFWPLERVAFRASTVPEIVASIPFPITATSANLAGAKPIFSVLKLQQVFGDSIQLYDALTELPETDPSEIWYLTHALPTRLR